MGGITAGLRLQGPGAGAVAADGPSEPRVGPAGQGGRRSAGQGRRPGAPRAPCPRAGPPPRDAEPGGPDATPARTASARRPAAHATAVTVRTAVRFGRPRPARRRRPASWRRLVRTSASPTSTAGAPSTTTSSNGPRTHAGRIDGDHSPPGPPPASWWAAGEVVSDGVGRHLGRGSGGDARRRSGSAWPTWGSTSCCCRWAPTCRYLTATRRCRSSG